MTLSIRGRLGMLDEQVVADVKCYFCGHISGQVMGHRGRPFRARRFIPRPGYEGPEVKPGTRLRCERCRGPVFLEDSTPMELAEGELAATLKAPKTAVKKRPAA
jgi:hypothetical protein